MTFRLCQGHAYEVCAAMAVWSVYEQKDDDAWTTYFLCAEHAADLVGHPQSMIDPPVLMLLKRMDYGSR